jgi:hypothetical protein
MRACLEVLINLLTTAFLVWVGRKHSVQRGNHKLDLDLLIVKLFQSF